ncbi:uncharacterized protein LOC125035945 [Penaeus chinensis]|uniref:uncharacterized protein LOC125035945 n=1 Tax=Penaeus chinensis TaxID=139456 RepID=UPI001FB7693A|nr:uncharacterized protein LOC125035945 [Penaeus chinensis]
MTQHISSLQADLKACTTSLSRHCEHISLLTIQDFEMMSCRLLVVVALVFAAQVSLALAAAQRWGGRGWGSPAFARPYSGGFDRSNEFDSFEFDSSDGYDSRESSNGYRYW